MNKLLLLLLVLFPLALRAQGWGDWQHRTPGGHIMGDEGTGTFLEVYHARRITGITRWFFYNHHIVGHCPLGFFVVEERTGATATFSSAADWEHYQQAHHLVPWVWTRWHSDDWTSGQGLGSGGLVALLGWGAFVWGKERRATAGGMQPRTRSALGPFLLAMAVLGVALWTTLASYPQSI